MSSFFYDSKILVVDEQAECARMVGRLIAGHPDFSATKVVTATTMAAATRLVEREHPLVVLQEIAFADGDGLQFLRQMKKVHPIIQCIVVTGVGSSEWVVGAIRAGAVDYLLKPIDEKLLKRALEEALARCRRWGDLFQTEYDLGAMGEA